MKTSFSPFCRLKLYIYEYMVKKNLHTSARIFKEEAGVPIGLEGNIVREISLL